VSALPLIAAGNETSDWRSALYNVIRSLDATRGGLFVSARPSRSNPENDVILMSSMPQSPTIKPKSLAYRRSVAQVEGRSASSNS